MSSAHLKNTEIKMKMHNTVFQVALMGLLSKYEHGYQSSDILTNTNILHGNANNCFKA